MALCIAVVEINDNGFPVVGRLTAEYAVSAMDEKEARAVIDKEMAFYHPTVIGITKSTRRMVFLQQIGG